MFSQRVSLVSASVLVVLTAGGYWYYSKAVQGEGVLAQAPMNVQNKVKPAFIMAVDDSNSMTFERIFPGGDGRLKWNTANNSFFNNDGSFYGVGEGCDAPRGQRDSLCYLYLFPHNKYNESYNLGVAIPPIESQGFARSPDLNKGYFNPGVKYEPWMKADGQREANASLALARADPRPEIEGGRSITSHTILRIQMAALLLTNIFTCKRACHCPRARSIRPTAIVD